MPRSSFHDLNIPHISVYIFPSMSLVFIRIWKSFGNNFATMQIFLDMRPKWHLLQLCHCLWILHHLLCLTTKCSACRSLFSYINRVGGPCFWFIRHRPCLLHHCRIVHHLLRLEGTPLRRLSSGSKRLRNVAALEAHRTELTVTPHILVQFCSPFGFQKL